MKVQTDNVIDFTDSTDFVSTNRNGTFGSKFKNRWLALISLPKTVLFNFIALPLNQAVKLPILVRYDTKIAEIHKGIISFSASPNLFMVKIGFGGSEGIAHRKSILCFEKGKVVFGNHNVFSEGVSIRNSGSIIFSDEYYCNKNCTIWSNEEIRFGTNITIGWNVTFRDCDGHLIITDCIKGKVQAPIIIGDNVWICSESDFLKGSGCSNDCVIGYRSLVLKYFDTANVLIAGEPAKVIKNHVSWIHG